MKDPSKTKIATSNTTLLEISIFSLLVWTVTLLILVWILYGFFGHQLINLLYNNKSLDFALMRGRAFTPVENYYRHADAVLVLGTSWFVTLWALVLVIRRPLGAFLVASSLVFSSFLLFCVLEVFPSLIRPLHLGTIHPYYGYKVNYIYDDELVYRENPLTHVISHEFKGSHYSPLYGIDVPPATTEYILDENGFRNSRTASRSDVAVLGDSYVVFGDNEADTFVSRLGKKLPGLTVVNLGASGYGPNHYLEVLKRFGLRYKPKYALFSFFEGNDIANIQSYLQWKRGKVPDDESLVYRLPKKSFFQRYWIAAAEAVASFRREYRFLIELALHKIAQIQGYAQDADDVHPDLALLDLGDEKRYKALFVDRLSTESTKQMLASQTFRAFRDILGDFRDICADNNIVPIILYIPAPVHIYGPYSTEASGENWLRVRDKQIAARENTERAVQYLAHELRIDFISLSPIFEAAAKKGALLYMQLDSHWNSQGREIAAEYVSNILKSKFIVPSTKLEHRENRRSPSRK